MHRATAIPCPLENDQTFLATAYLKIASNATFFEKRPYTESDRPITTKPRTWTWDCAIR
jgi:hypothetical protein